MKIFSTCRNLKILNQRNRTKYIYLASLNTVVSNITYNFSSLLHQLLIDYEPKNDRIP